MPIYEYRCPKCELVLERIVAMKDADQKQLCPHCETPTEKQISVPSAPLFKGDGWTPKYHKQ